MSSVHCLEEARLSEHGARFPTSEREKYFGVALISGLFEMHHTKPEFVFVFEAL